MLREGKCYIMNGTGDNLIVGYCCCFQRQRNTCGEERERVSRKCETRKTVSRVLVSCRRGVGAKERNEISMAG